MNQFTESMSQIQIYTVSAPPKIQCNQIGHESEFISHVCLRADCQEQRAHCRKCNLNQHRQCAGEIRFLDEITDQIKQIDQTNMQIFNIIERAIQKFQHVLKDLNSIRQFVQQYSDLPSLSNLNIVAGILNYYSPQQIDRLLKGQDLLDNLIQSHYSPQLTQLVEKQSKNRKFNIQEINNRNSDNNNNTNTNTNPKTNTSTNTNTNVNPNTNTNSNTYTTTNTNTNTNANFNSNTNTNTNPNSNLNSNPNPNTNSNSNTNTNTNHNPNANVNANPNPKSNQIDEFSAQQYHALAKLHYDKQEYAEAFEKFDLALALNPNNSSSWNNKGTALNKLDRDAESIECFDNALEILNSKPQIDLEAKLTYIGNKASTLGRLGQFKYALTLIDEVLALDPYNKTFFELKILTLIQSNQLNEALKIVDEAIQLDQNKTLPLISKGLVLSKLKKIEEAMDCYCMANSIKPKKKTYYLLGKLLEDQCQFDQAESCYKSALELDQNFDEAKKQLQIVQLYQQFK